MALKQDEWWMARDGWQGSACGYSLSHLRLKCVGGAWRNHLGTSLWFCSKDFERHLDKSARLAPGEGPIKVRIEITKVED